MSVQGGMLKEALFAALLVTGRASLGAQMVKLRSPVGYSPLGHTESDTTEQLHFTSRATKPNT